MAVLYRKYRPTQLEDVVGQEQVTSTLSNALKTGKIAHAYLFIGPRGTGKTSVARIFAHAVNGFDYQVEDSYLDIIEIDAASNTGVDNIRELREKAVIAPTKGKYKVYIIDEVHMLTKSASNALLKTLEEPPEHVIFIMATTDAYKVPITISSRTQVHTFKLASAETMLQHLRKVADQEKIQIDDEALQLVVQRGGGSFRDSLSLLDQISSLSDDLITAEHLSSALGLPAAQATTDLLESYAAGDSTRVQSLLKDLLNTGVKPETIASELIERIIASPSAETLALLEKLPEVQPPFPEAKLLLALLEKMPLASVPRTATQAAAPATRPTAQATAQPTASAMPEPTAKPAPKVAKTDAVTEAISPETASAAPRSAETSAAPSDQALAETTPKTASTITTETQTASKAANQPFAWDSFLERVHAENDAIFLQLRKVDYEFDGETLHLYPQQKLTKGILERPRNSQIIASCLDGHGFTIHEIGEKTQPQDETLSQISAIMGDVREINGDSPF